MLKSKLNVFIFIAISSLISQKTEASFLTKNMFGESLGKAYAKTAFSCKNIKEGLINIGYLGSLAALSYAGYRISQNNPYLLIPYIPAALLSAGALTAGMVLSKLIFSDDVKDNSIKGCRTSPYSIPTSN